MRCVKMISGSLDVENSHCDVRGGFCKKTILGISNNICLN